MTTYRERREAKAERLREWAGKREAQSDAMHDAARAHTAGIEFGQPILVGHHSERRHRNAIEKGWDAMGRAVENDRKAGRMAGRADEIDRQAANAIYSDDPDAIERLTAKLDGMEAERDRIKAKRAAVRKEHGAALRGLSAWEREEVMRAAGAPQYAITNLGGNISRTRDRIARLSREQQTGPRDRMISARFASSCEECGARIEKGDSIRYNRQAGARCAVCPTEGSK